MNHNYVIYALDISISSEALKPRNTAWVKLNVTGELEEVGYNIAELAQSIGMDLQRGIKVALGFEAPMWIPLPLISEDQRFKMTGRFHNELIRNSIRWFEGGAAPLVKTLPIGYMLFKELLNVRMEVSATCSIEDWSRADMFLFEGFATGEYKGKASKEFHLFKEMNGKLSSDDLVDAYLIASAFHQRLSGSYAPLLRTISWAHHLEVTSSRTDSEEVKVTAWNRDATGNVLTSVDTMTHGGFISVWDLIVERVNSERTLKPSSTIRLLTSHEACPVYGFMFE
ncbi:hypothetical protein SAMN05444162_3071 [Paenibacillaceae bacterium GAS479]|nr:hypothetical protein SAMN05444162_3071 [Paenibacillaceae bacterium GAS479]